MKIGAFIVGSRNSSGKDLARLSPILYEASDNDVSRKDLIAGDYDMHDSLHDDDGYYMDDTTGERLNEKDVIDARRKEMKMKKNGQVFNEQEDS